MEASFNLGRSGIMKKEDNVIIARHSATKM